MCLYKGLNEMQTASEDIVCYKIVEIIDGKIKSYFQQSQIKLNVPIEASNPCSASDMNVTTKLTDEVVHSYKEPNFSDEYITDLKIMSVGYHNIHLMQGHKVKLAVLECVIPKGTLYCTNLLTYSGRLAEYGSVKLIPKKIIFEYELKPINYNKHE